VQKNFFFYDVGGKKAAQERPMESPTRQNLNKKKKELKRGVGERFEQPD